MPEKIDNPNVEKPISRGECLKRSFRKIFTDRWNPDIDIKRTKGEIAFFVVLFPITLVFNMILLPINIIYMMIAPDKFNKIMCDQEHQKFEGRYTVIKSSNQDNAV